MIPKGWQPIGEPPVPELSADAKRVRAYIQEHGLNRISHKTIAIMCKCLKIGYERMVDAIYEIRKQEDIRMGKLTNQQRAAIYAAYKDGTPQKNLAEQYGVTVQAISQLITKLNKAEQELTETPADKPKPGIINPEFDAAVNEMIAENRSAIAEETSAPPKPDEPLKELMFEEITEEPPSPAAKAPKLPDFVLYAVDCRISELEKRLQDFADEKALLEHDLRRLKENIEAVQDEHDKLADWKLEVDP